MIPQMLPNIYGLINLIEYGQNALTDAQLQQNIDIVAAAIPYKGTYPSLAALTLAVPTADDGDYAVINLGGSVRAKLYIWDSETPGWTRAGDIPVESTGVFYGGQVTINALDNTKFDVAMGAAVFINFTDPTSPTQVLTVFGPLVAQTVTNIATAPATYLAVAVDGTIQQFTSPLTETQRRTYAQNMILVHTNLTNLNLVNENAATTRSGINQLHDLIIGLGPFNREGNVYSPNGANRKLNRSAGKMFKMGCNFFTNPDDPHNKVTPVDIALTFRYRNQTGETGGNVTDIDPDNYDLNGVTTAVPNNRWTVQEIVLFQSGVTRIQRGQRVFQNLTDALTAISNGTLGAIKEANIKENGLFRYYLIVKKGAIALDNMAEALFIEAPGIGGSHGGIPAVRDHFRGSYTTLTDLQTAHPTSEVGDYAVVDAGTGIYLRIYWWDAVNEGWVQAVTDHNVITLTSVAGVLTINRALGSYFKVDLIENITTINITNAPAATLSDAFTLWIKQDPAVARTVTFDTALFRPALGVTLTVSATLGRLHLFTGVRGYDTKYDVTLSERET